MAKIFVYSLYHVYINTAIVVSLLNKCINYKQNLNVITQKIIFLKIIQKLRLSADYV